MAPDAAFAEATKCLVQYMVELTTNDACLTAPRVIQIISNDDALDLTGPGTPNSIQFPSLSSKCGHLLLLWPDGIISDLCPLIWPTSCTVCFADHVFFWNWMRNYRKDKK
jgi:hypothetical protein